MTPVEVSISLSSAESESSTRTEEEKLSEMRMIEDPVLTLCHYPSPGSNPDVPEKKKPRVLPTVSLSLLCFSPPLATSPPLSPLNTKTDPNSPPTLPAETTSSLSSTITSSSFIKPSIKLHHTEKFDKIEDSLNTPVTAAAGSGFFSSSVPLLDPPPIGKQTTTLCLCILPP